MKYENYIGKTIGNFTILEELNKVGRKRLIATCNICGKKGEFNKYDILSQNIKSCGCTRFKDYTGQTIGNFTVIKELGHKRIIARCNLCGKEKEFDKTDIITKKNKSCGCLINRKNTTKNKSNFKDYTNQTIGNITILKELGRGRVIARCNLCGIEREFNKSKIVTGKQKSCGCLNYKDYTNKNIGNFTILEELNYNRIKARCNICGNEKEFNKASLILQRQKSCGCLPSKNSYKSKLFKGYKILNYEYTGRNHKEYFLVENLKTHIEEILNVDEILEKGTNQNEQEKTIFRNI